MKENGIRTTGRLISIPRAARLLDISERTIKRYIKETDIIIYVVGKRKRIAEADINKLVNKQESLDDLENHEF